MHNLVYSTLAAGRYATSVELDSRGKTLLRGLILAVAFMLAANGVPAEQLRNVLGTIALEFVPAEGATAPEPPMDVILVMRRLPDGQQIRPRVADSLAVWDKDRATSHQNFRLTLPPGSYQILGIEILAPSLSGDQVPLPFGASFVVQDTGCVYLGRMRFEFLRLPAASFATSKDMAVAIAEARGLKQIGFYYSVKGALVVSSILVDTPPESERTLGDEHDARHYTEAVTRRCTVDLARFEPRVLE